MAGRYAPVALLIVYLLANGHALVVLTAVGGRFRRNSQVVFLPAPLTISALSSMEQWPSPFPPDIAIVPGPLYQDLHVMPFLLCQDRLCI